MARSIHYGLEELRDIIDASLEQTSHEFTANLAENNFTGAAHGLVLPRP